MAMNHASLVKRVSLRQLQRQQKNAGAEERATALARVVVVVLHGCNAPRIDGRRKRF